MTGAIEDRSAHTRGLDKIGEAMRLAKSRQGEKPAGEYMIGQFIIDTDKAFLSIEQILKDAMDLMLVPKAESRLKGGTQP